MLHSAAPARLQAYKLSAKCKDGCSKTFSISTDFYLDNNLPSLNITHQLSLSSDMTCCKINMLTRSDQNSDVKSSICRHMSHVIPFILFAFPFTFVSTNLSKVLKVLKTLFNLIQALNSNLIKYLIILEILFVRWPHMLAFLKLQALTNILLALASDTYLLTRD